MLRLAGILMLICTCTVLGLSKSASLRARAKVVSSSVDALEMMRGEICTRLTPMGELCERLSENGPDEMREMFFLLSRELETLGERSFSEIWEYAVENAAPSHLKREERETLTALGLALGRFDASEQELAINRAIERLEHSLSKAKAEAESGGRLYSGLGLAFGLMLSVILI